MASSRRTLLLMDANVLIDFQAANPKFITAQILDRFLKRIGATVPRAKR